MSEEKLTDDEAIEMLGKAADLPLDELLADNLRLRAENKRLRDYLRQSGEIKRAMQAEHARARKAENEELKMHRATRRKIVDALGLRDDPDA